MTIFAVFAAAADKVHEHGSLFGIELVHGGLSRSNRMSRMAPLAPSHGVNKYPTRPQPRAMDLDDIKELRRWHREAALRAKRAGADLVYVYAAHNIALPMHFLLPRYNRRNDDYGGKLENRVRLLRELLEDTKDAVGDTWRSPCASLSTSAWATAGLQWREGGPARSSPCWPSCPTFGTSTSRAGSTIRRPAASPRKATRKTPSPSSRS